MAGRLVSSTEHGTIASGSLGSQSQILCWRTAAQDLDLTTMVLDGLLSKSTLSAVSAGRLTKLHVSWHPFNNFNQVRCLVSCSQQL